MEDQPIVPQANAISIDREFKVPEGYIVKTGYVHLKDIRFGLYNRMSMEAVEKAYRKHLQMGGAASFPPPNGFWEGSTFVVCDGRHEVVGAMIAGKSTIFVCWLEKP